MDIRKELNIIFEDKAARHERMRKMFEKTMRELKKDTKFYESSCKQTERGSIQRDICDRTKKRIKDLKYDLRMMRITFGGIKAIGL